MTKIETVGKYHICKDSNGKYWAIKKEWLDGKGRLTRSVNGLEGQMSDSLEQCRERVRNSEKYAALLADGVPPMVAVVMVHNPGWEGKSREEVETALREKGIKF